MERTSPAGRSRNAAIGLGLVAAGVIVVVWRGILAAQAARAWFENRVLDRSAAELYSLTFWINLGAVAFGIALAWFGRRLLRVQGVGGVERP
jgi:hypothetical protein